MLLSQDRRGHQQGHLPAIEHGLEGRTQGHLCFAVPDITTDQAIHRLGRLHIRLDVVNRLELVRGFQVGKAALQLTLPLTIRRVGETGRRLPVAIQFQQLLGDLGD